MMLIEETTVPDGALPVEAFKAHLRLGSGFDADDVQDALVSSFLRAAMAAVEARTGWRGGDAQVFPVAPVVAVSAVARVARDGVETVVDGAAYWVERDIQQPRLRAVGAALPSVPAGGAVKVSFVAGFGPDWASLPGDLAQAVLMLAAHYYEYRNDTGLSDGCMPFGVSSLIERYKAVRIGFGA
jgi:uncharacterized phiE125 gp8 family phage protein